MSAPLDFPGAGAAMQEFELQRVDYGAPEAGGRVGGVQAGQPLWRAVWTIGKIGAERSDAWRAWLARMRGAVRRFYGADLGRPYPKAHIGGFGGMTRAGGGAFDGSATDWSETINADDESELALEGLPAGLILSLGDYVGFQWETESEDRRALVRVVIGGEADGGGDLTVSVEPPVPSTVPAGATAHLDQPRCIMVMITDQSKLEAIDRRLAVRGGTIAAVQDLRE